MRGNATERRSLLLLAGMLALACSSPPPPPPPEPAPPPEPEPEFVYWAKVDAAPPAGAVAGYNACGATLTVAGARIPNHPAIEPATVNQIDANANIVRSWSVPLATIPVALDGDAILVRPEDSDELLQIGADGTIQPRDLPQLARPSPGACPPRPLDQYAPDVLCVEAVDLSTRQRVTLEFEEACD